VRKHNFKPLKFSYVLIFSVILIFFFPNPVEGAVGSIGDTVIASSEVTPNDTVQTSSIIKISNTIYAIAYTDANADGKLITFSVSGTGATIGAVIETLTFDTTGLNPDIIRVSGDIYAIVYSGPDSGVEGTDGFVKTVSIDSAGNIGNAVLATLEFDTTAGDQPDIINVSGTIYAVAYAGRGGGGADNNAGVVRTFSISNDGTTIGAVLDTLIFDTTDGDTSKIVNVSGDIFAIAYEDENNDGKVATVDIDSAGTIGNAAVTTFTYDANVGAGGASNSLINVSGNIFAIAYQSDGNLGTVQAVSISNDGTTLSTTGLGSLDFDTSAGSAFPKIISISSSVFAISYDDTGGAGSVATVEISQDGTLVLAIDTLQYDAAGIESSIVRGVNDVYVIAYSGADTDGFVTTISIITSLKSGSGCVETCSPPTLGLDQDFFRIIENGFSYNGNPVDVEYYYTSYPLITVKVAEKNVAVLKVFDDQGVDQIAHVALAFGLGEGDTFTKSQAMISLNIKHDGTETVSVTDPNNVLDNIDISTNVDQCRDDSDDECLIVSINHTFREPLDFNMVATYVWDQALNSWQNYYNHGIEILGESLNPPTVEYIEDRWGTMHVLQIEQVTDGIRLDENQRPWILIGDTWEPYIGSYSQIHPETIEEIGTPTVLERDYEYWHLIKQGEVQFAQEKLNDILGGKSIHTIHDNLIETDDRAYYRTLHRDSDSWNERLQAQELLAIEKLKRMLGGELIGGYDS